MHRFYCSSCDIAQDEIRIKDKEQIHYIKDVLRLKPRDNLLIFDGQGNEYACLIKELSGKIILQIKEKHLFSGRQPEIRITMGCALPRGSRMDDIVDKLTQLGVERIIPLETERVIVKLDKSKKLLRQKRWEKIALNAAQQSGRQSLVVIEPVKNIKEVLSETRDFDLILIPCLSGNRQSLKEVLTPALHARAGSQSKPIQVLVLIGPEGDFSDVEVALAKKAGCIPVSLGDLVLRVETAAIAVVSFIKFYAEG